MFATGKIKKKELRMKKRIVSYVVMSILANLSSTAYSMDQNPSQLATTDEQNNPLASSSSFIPNPLEKSTSQGTLTRGRSSSFSSESEHAKEKRREQIATNVAHLAERITQENATQKAITQLRESGDGTSLSLSNSGSSSPILNKPFQSNLLLSLVSPDKIPVQIIDNNGTVIPNEAPTSILSQGSDQQSTSKTSAPVNANPKHSYFPAAGIAVTFALLAVLIYYMSQFSTSPA
jgi:hypothetical protein